MEENVKNEWDALKKKFDDRNEQLSCEYEKRISDLDDAHRKGLRDREDRKFAFLTQLKREHRDAADTYIKTRRDLATELRKARKALELERQVTYAQFKNEHGMWGGEETQQAVSE